MLLAEYLLDRFNRDSASDPAWQAKTIAPSALNRLAHHPWSGNIRELANTLARAALWSASPTITERDIEDALLELPSVKSTGDEIFGQDVALGIDLQHLMDRLARHYLQQAMKITGGNKTRASELLGLPSYQTLTNWLKKYDVLG
jgi:DNA-binding NtrC family response regulator